MKSCRHVKFISPQTYFLTNGYKLCINYSKASEIIEMGPSRIEIAKAEPWMAFVSIWTMKHDLNIAVWKDSIFGLLRIKLVYSAYEKLRQH